MLKWTSTGGSECRNLLVSAAPICDHAGKVSGAVGVFQDVTDFKEVQRELRRAHDELELRVVMRTQELAEVNVELRALSHEERKQTPTGRDSIPGQPGPELSRLTSKR